MIYLISFTITIIFFLLLCFIFNLKYLLLIFLGLFFLLLFVLNIKGSEKIITNYLTRKKINYISLLNNKYKLFLYSFIVLFILSLYIWSISSRLFIIINNIFVYFLNGELEKMSLYLSIIIVILLISVILVWMDILDKKYKKGKYNKYSVFIGIFLVLSLFYSIILFITGWGIEYIYILKIISQLTILIEIFSFFMNSDLVLLNIWEEEILPNININIINLKFNEIKNYINMKMLRNKIFYDNYTIHRNINTNYSGYKRLLIKGRSNNLFIRSIYFVLDFIILMREKLYSLHYFNAIKIKNIYNIKWNYKVSMFPIGNINNNEKGKYDFRREDFSHSLVKDDSVENVLDKLKKDTILKTNSDQSKNISYPSPVGDRDPRPSTVPTEPGGTGARTSFKRGNLNVDTNEDDDYVLKRKKRNITPVFLKDANFTYIDKEVYYPNTGNFSVIDLCNEVIKEVPNFNKNQKEDINLDFLGESKDCIFKYENMIYSPYYIRLNTSTYHTIYIIKDYLRVYNSAIQNRLSVINFINTCQMEKLTILISDLIAQPIRSELLLFRKNNNIDLSRYGYVDSVFYVKDSKEFSNIKIRVPNIQVMLYVEQLYANLRKHGFVLDSSLNYDNSLILKIKYKAFINNNVYDGTYSNILKCLRDIETCIFKNIRDAEAVGFITKREQEIYNKYYLKYFTHLKEQLNVRTRFLRQILVDCRIPQGSIAYLYSNLDNWNFNNEKVFNDTVGKGSNDIIGKIPDVESNYMIRKNIFQVGLNPSYKWISLSKSNSLYMSQLNNAKN